MIDNEEIKKFRSEFKALERKIVEYDRIIVYRHTSPDFDALGAQLGLVTWIRDNFPEKIVHFVGDGNPGLIPALFPEPEKVDDAFFMNGHLAIVVDVGDSARISQERLALAKETIKIDHHELPVPELDYGDLRIVHPKRPAASEIIALFALSRGRKRRLTKEAAAYLYCGIVGDTGRFMYQDTDGATLRIAADLLDFGIDMTGIYRKMYRTDERKLAILQYCLSHYRVTEKGTCYYVIDKEDLARLNMTTLDGNLHINTFREMEGVRAAVSVTYDPEKEDYRVSIRSACLVLHPAVSKFHGGGHDYAAGCRLKSLEELPLLLAEIDKL